MAITEKGHVVFGAQPLTESGQIVWGNLTENADLVFPAPTPLGWRSRTGFWVGGLSGASMATPLGWRSRAGFWVGGLNSPSAPSGFTLAAAAGSYLISGAAATLSSGGNTVLAAASGSYAITGAPATMTFFNGAYTLAADAGVYTINGQPVAFGGTGVSQPMRQIMGVGL